MDRNLKKLIGAITGPASSATEARLPRRKLRRRAAYRGEANSAAAKVTPRDKQSTYIGCGAAARKSACPVHVFACTRFYGIYTRVAGAQSRYSVYKRTLYLPRSRNESGPGRRAANCRVIAPGPPRAVCGRTRPNRWVITRRRVTNDLKPEDSLKPFLSNGRVTLVLHHFLSFFRLVD